MALLTRTAALNFGGIDDRLVCRDVWPFVDSHIAMQRHGQVGDPERFNDGQDYGALDVVAGAIFPVRLGGSDVKVGDVAGARAEGQGEA